MTKQMTVVVIDSLRVNSVDWAIKLPSQSNEKTFDMSSIKFVFKTGFSDIAISRS